MVLMEAALSAKSTVGAGGCFNIKDINTDINPENQTTEGFGPNHFGINCISVPSHQTLVFFYQEKEGQGRGTQEV